MVLKGRGWLDAGDLGLTARDRDAGPLATPASIPATVTRRQRALELAAGPAGVSTRESHALPASGSRSPERNWAHSRRRVRSAARVPGAARGTCGRESDAAVGF